MTRADEPPDEQARRSVRDLLDGYRGTSLVVASVQLGLLEMLADGAADPGELAEHLGAHPPSLLRFLRGLRVLGLVSERHGRFVLTPAGRILLPGASAAPDLALLIGEEYLPAWSAIRHSILTGEPAFHAVFGTDIWRHRENRPELNDAFNRYMGRLERRASEAIEQAFDFSGRRLVIDVGGGTGALVAGLLARHDALRGVVFDLPHVVRGATAVLESAGVLDRCHLVGGSFFDAVPASGDAYVLRYILHDWDDDRSRTILERCRQAMQDDASLLIVEDVLPEKGSEPRGVVMQDLHMMVLLGGRERTEPEYARLLVSAGLRLARRTEVNGTHVIEAVPESR